MMTTIDAHALRLAVCAQLQQLNRSFIRWEVPPVLMILRNCIKISMAFVIGIIETGAPSPHRANWYIVRPSGTRPWGITSGAGRSYTLS